MEGDDSPGQTRHWKIQAANNKCVSFLDEKEKEWTGPFCFVQAADTQFGLMATLRGDKESHWEEEMLLARKAVEKINGMSPKPKFAIICGDLVDAMPEAHPTSRSAQVSDFTRIFCDVDPSIPLLCVCGNHDVGNTPTCTSIEGYRSTFGDDYYAFWCSGVFFIVLNSQYYADKSLVGTFADQHDAWLDSQLSKIKTMGCKHAVIFQHIPWFLHQPDEPDDYFSITMSLRKPMLRKLKAAGVNYIFCGHYHRNAGGFDGDMEEVVTSAVGFQLGDDQSGFRVVKVLEEKLEHAYYGLDDVPKDILF